MSNKITRRVALGTIAGGLGGAALILRSLKGKYETEVPESGNFGSPIEHYYKSVRHATFKKLDSESFAKEWDHDRHPIDISIKTIRGPSSVRLGFEQQKGLDFRVLSICAITTRK